MPPTVFKPRYSALTWSLLAAYALPWLLAGCCVLDGGLNADWRLFWLLSGTGWLVAGLLHLKAALLKRIELGDEVRVEMVLQKPAAQPAAAPVRICGDTLLLERQTVHLQYLGNGPELMQQLVRAAGQGRLNLVYEQRDAKPQWTAARNFACLVVFALYMAAALWLGFRPVRLVGPATDAMLAGWAAMLPVLLAVMAVRGARKRLCEGHEKWL